MEMYCLHKYGVSIGVSGSGAWRVKFIVFQVVLLVTGAVLWIAHGGFVDAHTQGSKWFILMGYVVNCLFRRNGGADGHQPAGGALGD